MLWMVGFAFLSGLLLIVAGVAWIYERFIDALIEFGYLAPEQAARYR